ncbi:MAG: hypothetical protein ACPGU1_17560 [Myxococcota bacterium]
MMRSDRWATFWALLSVLVLTGCGSIDLTSGNACQPYCADGAPYVCNAAGQAVAAQPCDEGFTCLAGSCAPESCPADSCSAACPCEEGSVCTDGTCVTACVPECDSSACGADGCGGSCGSCAEGLFCVEGACSDTCEPACDGKVCGDDGCGGGCGECAAEEFCVEGACVTECDASCGDAVCGDDGCGGSCGECPEGQNCAAGACVLVCAPDCQGKVCGPDGCGGTCGSCGDTDGAACDDDGQCVCTPEVSVGCADEDTAAFLDSCGNVGEVVLDCPGGMLCEAGECSCQAAHATDCVEGAPTEIGSYDSCGVYEETIETCEGGQVCQAGACQCAPVAEPACAEDGDVYSVDSCGTPLELIEDCLPGAVCTDGACLCSETSELDCVAGVQGSNCCSPHPTPGCDNPEVVACVCEAQPSCCDDVWNEDCLEAMWAEGCGTCEGTWSHQPVAIDSCGQMTPTGECPVNHVCQGKGICTQTEAFCDNQTDSLLLEAQDLFGDESTVDNGDCYAASQVIQQVEQCVGDYCGGDWGCEASNDGGVSQGGPCDDLVGACSELPTCAGYLSCLQGCGADQACVVECLPGSTLHVLGACIDVQYQQELLISAPCASCFGDYFDCVFATCLGPCGDNDCTNTCVTTTCMPQLFECMGPVQYMCDSYCSERECGDDWCGGSCGTCNDAQVCSPADGTCDCPCAQVTCEDEGFQCGSFECDSDSCEGDASGCGSLNEPWAEWNTSGSELTGGQVVSAVLPVIGDETGAVANNGAASPSWTMMRVGDAGMVGSPPFEMLEVGVLTFDVSGIPEGAVIESALLRMYQAKVVGELPFMAENYVHVGVQHIRFEGFSWDAVVGATPVEATGTENYQVILSSDPSLGWKNVDIAPAVRYELATCQERLQLRVLWLPEFGNEPNETFGDGTQESNQVHFNSDNAKDNNPAITISYRIGGVPVSETEPQTGAGGTN